MPHDIRLQRLASRRKRTVSKFTSSLISVCLPVITDTSEESLGFRLPPIVLISVLASFTLTTGAILLTICYRIIRRRPARRSVPGEC